MNTTLREHADALGMALQIGLISRDEIIAWVDGLIEKEVLPAEWMTDLSLSKGKHPLDIVHMLHEVPGESNPDASFQILLQLMEDRHPNVSRKDEKFLRELFSFVHCPISERFKRLIYQLDGNLDVVLEGHGNWSAIQADYEELLSERDSSGKSSERKEEVKNYSEQLKPLRFWNRVGILSFVLAFPISGVMGLVVPRRFSFFLTFAIFSVSIALFIYSYFRIRTFRCPRCKEYFTVMSAISPNTRGRKCVHCGLELKYSAQHRHGR
jgi:hypothetical protein